MARIVILEHEFQIANPFMLAAFAIRWAAAGHEVLWHRGIMNPPPGDLAILHVNMTVVTAPYRALLKHYPKVINGSVVDISKRLFSENILARDVPWQGPVIVKTNTNFGGLPEFNARAAEQRLGLQSDIPVGPRLNHYPIFPSINDVPDPYWQEPDLIVERFTPEIDDDGNYCVRVWTFFGDEQRCALWRSKDQQVKSGNVFERSAVDPPRNLNHWRKRLGFEFGKFDYVIHNGREVLLDVNRTPTFPRGGSPNAERAADQLARPRFISKRSMTMVDVDIAARYREYLEQFGSRGSDIWVATFSKSGTTWMQMILYQLTTSGDMGFEHLFDVSPWIYYAALRGVTPADPTDPRILKTHDDYAFMAGRRAAGKTVYVMRDGKDVAVSWYHHRRNFQGCEGSFDDHFEEFLNDVNYNWFVHVKDWITNRLKRPVFVVKYEDLLEDFEQCVTGVAKFCDINVDETAMARVRKRSTFDFMKAHDAQLGPQASHFPTASSSPYKIKSAPFLRRGQRGEGANYLSTQQLQAYRRKFDEVLGDVEAVAEYR